VVLDCPEAVDEALTDLYGNDSFLASSEYLGAFERYGETVERMTTTTVVNTTPGCLVDSSTSSCRVDADPNHLCNQ